MATFRNMRKLKMFGMYILVSVEIANIIHTTHFPGGWKGLPCFSDIIKMINGDKIENSSTPKNRRQTTLKIILSLSLSLSLGKKKTPLLQAS